MIRYVVRILLLDSYTQADGLGKGIICIFRMAGPNHLNNCHCLAERRFILPNKNLLSSKRFWLLTVCLICAVGVLFVIHSPSVVAGEKANAKNMDRMKAYQVYQAKCTGCHDSVANPELPGRTRDDWHLVVNVMHGYGLGLTIEESDMIIDLLYDLRKGLEREAG
jgi:hypothetical protein